MAVGERRLCLVVSERFAALHKRPLRQWGIKYAHGKKALVRKI